MMIGYYSSPGYRGFKLRYYADAPARMFSKASFSVIFYFVIYYSVFVLLHIYYYHFFRLLLSYKIISTV